MSGKMGDEESRAPSRMPSSYHQQNVAFRKLVISDDDGGYDWREFFPKDKTCWNIFRWLVVGGAANAELTEEKFFNDLENLACCLSLIRAYLEKFGMPEEGGKKDQDFVLRNMVQDLYAGGAPLWALEAVAIKAAEGLTGSKGANWMFMPRKALVFSPSTGTTHMFAITRGFAFSKLNAMEKVAVRLASFASNSKSVGNVPTRFPSMEELQLVKPTATLVPDDEILGGSARSEADERQALADKILALASESSGLFFFVNSNEYKEQIKDRAAEDEFWCVSDRELELFSRLAAMHGRAMIGRIDEKEKKLYPGFAIVLFRVMTASGACAFWFNGSWQDMIVAALLALMVAGIGESPWISRQERLVFEVIASFVVGAVAEAISLKWPNDTCFAAMALGGILDILQGFRVVYAVIELMSRNTVAGGANLIEGILFTGLIAYSLRFGQSSASHFYGETIDPELSACTNGIDKLYYIVIVPATALAWSGLFLPDPTDLVPMTFHGCLAYMVNYYLAKAKVASSANNFLSALIVALSAGIFSRFTGKTSVAYAVAGIYVLLPGAYLVQSLFSSEIDGSFFVEIVQRAITIGLGAWTGTMLFSNVALGTTFGLARQQSHHIDTRHSTLSDTGTMLCF